MKRILSPHVNIYKFPITAISSISTRLSGLYLTTGYIGFGSCCLFDIDCIKYYKSLDYYTKKMVNYSFIIPTTYHTYGGIRHIIWDKYPKLLTNNKVASSSYFLFGISIGTSVIVENYLNG